MTSRYVLAALAAGLLAAGPAMAAEGEQKITDVSFPYEGPFGTFDEMQLQRGFQVYQEVCASCHGMQYLAFRTLGDETGPNFPEEQVDGIAALYTVTDKETGEDRPAEATDYFPAGTYPGAPDLTLMAKARAGFHGPYGLGISQLINGIGGDEYIYSLLTHYTGESKEEAGTTLYENTAFPGNWISMPPPMSDGQIDYGVFGPHGGDPTAGEEGEGEEGEGGHAVDYAPPEATVEQMAKDVSAFLMWTAEPRMTARKEAGFRNVIVLIILAVLLYYTNKKLWRTVKGVKD